MELEVYDPPLMLPENIQLEADQLVEQIEKSGSLPAVVKNGARANGFTLGLTCSGVVSPERCELLALHFDRAVEKKMRLLLLGL